jgi:hypothetical protein
VIRDARSAWRETVVRTPLILVGVVAVVAVVVVALSSVGSDATPTPNTAASTPGGVQASPAGPPALLWPAPTDPLERTVEAGLEPAPKEFLANHVHAHLDVFADGEEIVVPAGIGINIDDPAVRKFDNPIGYGGIEMCDQPCISPLHTHDETGIIHTESSDPEPHTLGQFFTEWGVDLSETCVGEHCAPTPIAVYIGGELSEGDPRAIELTDQKVIVVVVGTPPAEIPSTADFSGA